MNLNSNIPFMASTIQDYSLLGEPPQLLDHAPRQYLSLIFQHDKSTLKEWFSNWMNDLISLQEAILCSPIKRYTSDAGSVERG